MARGTSPGKSIVLLAAAVALACVALLVLFGRPPAPPPKPSGPPAPAAAVEPADETSAELPVSQPMAPPAPPSPAPPEETAAPEPEPAPESEVEPAGESEPDVASGIGLFPPRGTDPIKIGIVVPEDFALPEGYLRHYQVTDDGQDLEPILLFHPDFEVFDEAGNPIPLPPDRVVPSELAPPGMPIRFLEVPLPLPDDAP